MAILEQEYRALRESGFRHAASRERSRRALAADQRQRVTACPEHLIWRRSSTARTQQSRHDRLMVRVRQHVDAPDVLELINRFLKGGVQVNGQKQATTEGAPQGGPLSPVLANTWCWTNWTGRWSVEVTALPAMPMTANSRPPSES